MKEIKATIVYPVDVKITVPDTAGTDFIWDSLMKAADGALGTSVAPVIHSCTEPVMVSHDLKQTKMRPESQADFVQSAITGLLNAKVNIDAAIIARPFLLALKARDGSSLVDKIARLAFLNKELSEDIIATTSPRP